MNSLCRKSPKSEQKPVEPEQKIVCPLKYNIFAETDGQSGLHILPFLTEICTSVCPSHSHNEWQLTVRARVCVCVCVCVCDAVHRVAVNGLVRRHAGSVFTGVSNVHVSFVCKCQGCSSILLEPLCSLRRRRDVRKSCRDTPECWS